MGIDSAVPLASKNLAGCGPVAMAQIPLVSETGIIVFFFVGSKMPTLTTEACLQLVRNNGSLASLFSKVVIAADTW